jgi:hypothetical protein
MEKEDRIKEKIAGTTARPGRGRSDLLHSFLFRDSYFIRIFISVITTKNFEFRSLLPHFPSIIPYLSFNAMKLYVWSRILSATAFCSFTLLVQ